MTVGVLHGVASLFLMRRTTIESRPVPSGLRRHALPALVSALLAIVTGCTHAAAARQSPSAQAPKAAAVLEDRRALPGAGAVAFDPSGSRLAWAAGSEVRILDLGAGTTSALAAAGWIDDVGFAPDGSLWTVGERVQRWQDDTAACTTEGVDADRLLAVDAQGAVVAGYARSDGVGVLRHQVWLDAACRVTGDSTQPLPAGIADAESDPGAPLGRASLHAPRVSPPAASAAMAGMPGAKAVVASADGRWLVVDVGGQRSLWKLVAR